MVGEYFESSDTKTMNGPMHASYVRGKKTRYLEYIERNSVSQGLTCRKRSKNLSNIDHKNLKHIKKFKIMHTK